MADRVQYDIIINDVASAKLRQIGTVGRKSLSSILPHAVRLNREIERLGHNAQRATASFILLGKSLDVFKDRSKSIRDATKDLKDMNAELRRSSKIDPVGRSRRRASSGVSGGGSRRGGFFYNAKGGLGNMAVGLNAFGLGRAAGIAGRTQSVLGMTSRVGMAAPFVGTGIGVALGTYRAATLQKQIAEVAAVTQATREEEKQLQAAAIEASRPYAFKPTEAAEALEFLGRAGFSAQDSMKALPTTLRMAQANVMDLGRAADITTNIVTGFNLSLDKLGEVADVLTATTTKSNTNLEMLGETMKYAAPTASLAGLAIEEVAGAAGVLAQAGLRSGIAGRGMRMLFADLIDPASKLNRELRAMGVDANLDGGLPGFLKQLEDANVSAVDILPFLSQNAGTVLSNLMRPGADNFEKFVASIREAEGITERIAGKQMSNVIGAFDRLLGNLEASGIMGTQPILSPLESLLNDMTDTVSDRRFVDALDDISWSFVEIGRALSTITNDMPSFISGFEAVADLFGTGSAVAETLSRLKDLSDQAREQDETRVVAPNSWEAMSRIPENIRAGAEFVRDLLPMTREDRGRQMDWFFKELAGSSQNNPYDLSYLNPLTDPLMKGINETDRNRRTEATRRPDPTVDDDVKADSSSIRGGVIVNIEKIIEQFTVETNNVGESVERIKDLVSEAMIETLREVEAYE